jgi:exonuclease III
LLAWNIRQGGGSRLGGIVAALARYDADAVVLSEYRSRTGPALRSALESLGYRHASATEPPRGRNGVLIASRRPVRDRGPLSTRVDEPYRMLEVEVAGLRLIGVYMPYMLGKVPYWEAVLRAAPRRRSESALILGDFNTTRHFVDEAGALCRTSDYMDRIEQRGFRDLYRHLQPDARDYSWYSSAGNGFRIDHAFGSDRLRARVAGVHYSHDERLGGLSDHSILVVESGAARRRTRRL